MATVVNARDVSLQATSPRTVTVQLGGVQVDWNNVANGSGNKAADNADVTLTQINGGLNVTGGGITLSSGGAIKGGQTAFATGTGFFLGYESAAYKFSIGNATNYLKWDGTSLSYSGDVSGSGNISNSGTLTITGSAFFRGATAGFNACGVFNDLGTQQYGVLAIGTVSAVLAEAAGTGNALEGVGSGGVGVRAECSTGTALKIEVSSTGKAMVVPATKLSTGTTTPSFTNAPGAGTTVKWFEFYDDAGNKWWFPAKKDT